MQSSIFAYDSAIEMKTCRGNKVTDIKLGMISLFFHYLQRIPFLIQNVHVWLTFSIKIILHRIISVVWLTNFLSEIRNLTKPRWWVEQVILSVKRYWCLFPEIQHIDDRLHHFQVLQRDDLLSERLFQSLLQRIIILKDGRNTKGSEALLLVVGLLDGMKEDVQLFSCRWQRRKLLYLDFKAGVTRMNEVLNILR